MLAVALGLVIWRAPRSEPSDAGVEPAPATSTPATTTTPTATSTTPTNAAPSASAGGSLDELTVAASPTTSPPYRRSEFGAGWSYDGSTGCSTRERVLIDESLTTPAVDDRCRPTNGRWRSVYDGIETLDPADLQIDHVVPLADAWRSGAAAWTRARRIAFANDLGSPDTLQAVSGSTNESKADRTPADWLPPDRSDWCSYASSWVRIKVRWGLTVTPSEHAALASILAGC